MTEPLSDRKTAVMDPDGKERTGNTRVAPPPPESRKRKDSEDSCPREQRRGAFSGVLTALPLPALLAAGGVPDVSGMDVRQATGILSYAQKLWIEISRDTRCTFPMR